MGYRALKIGSLPSAQIMSTAGGWIDRRRGARYDSIPWLVCGRFSEPGAPLLFADASQLLYSTGRSLARLDIHNSEVSFLSFPSQPATVTAATCSPNCKILAVSASRDAAGHKDQKICVFDCENGILKSTMLVETSFTRGSIVKHLAFSADGICLAGLCVGSTTSVLACWQWSSRRLLANVNCGMVAHSLAAHPSDPKEWTVCGARWISAYRLSEADRNLTRLTIKVNIGGERQFSAQAWLHDEVLAVCSLKGEVVIIQDAAQQVLMQLHTPLYCIAPVGKGFAVGTDSAVIRFRAVDSRIRDDKADIWYIQDSSHPIAGPVHSLTVSPDSKHILAGNAQGQLTPVELRLSQLDSTHSPAAFEGFSEQHSLPQSIYNRPVPGRPVSLDAVSLRPVVGVLDDDGWVSLLDYRSSDMLLQQQLIGRPTCLALHPLGLLLAIGSAEKLAFFYILADGLHLAAEMPLKRCFKAHFNHGGNRLAICAGRNVAIFSTISMRQERVLQGHLAEVAEVCWTQDDTRLISIGGSNLYHWSTATWQRLPDQDFCDKQLKFCQLTLLNQPELTAIVQSTSGQVMAVRKGTMIKSNYDWIPKDAIVKTADNGNILLHASPLGAVTSVELQLMPERQPLRQSQRTSPAGTPLPRHAWLHGDAIQHMVVLQSSGLLFSIGANGMLVMSKMPWPADAAAEPEWPGCSLVPDSHMQALQQRMRDLQMVADTAQRECEYEVLQATKALELERQHISEQMREQQQQVQKQLEDNEKERRRAEGKLRKALAAETTAHGHDLDLLEGGLLQRVQDEQQRLQAAIISHAAEMNAKEARIQQMHALHTAMLTEVTAAHESAVAIAQAKTAEGQALIEHLKFAHAEEIAQCDAEYEESYMTRRAQAIKEKEASERTEAKLRAKLHLLKSANHRLQNEKTSEADKAAEHAAAAISLQKMVKGLEADVKGLQGDITDRESVIASDYRAMHGQRAKIVNLESHNFVLDHRAQALQLTFKEHTSEVHKLQRQIDSLRIKHASEAEKAQALASSLDMQRTRVHTVLGELADAKARADRAQEAIASAHPLVTSLLVQTSMTPHERQQLGLTLAATLGVQNLPPAVAALTSQPSMFRQQSVALLSQGSGLSLGSPLPPWNLSSPRRATAPKSGWLSRGSSLAPGFSVAQSPKEHAKPRTRLGEASPVPEPQPEPVPDPYPEQPQMASRMPTPRASDAEQDAPKPAIKKPARQQQTTGTQTAAQDAPHAPLMPQQGEVPGATAKAPAAPADQDVPAPIPAQRKTAFMDIKVDVNLAQEADKPDGDASLKAAEYEQALRKAQECQHMADVAEARLATVEKELVRADKRAKAEIRRRTDENNDLVQELQSLQEANQQLTEEVVAVKAALKAASRQPTPREVVALAPPLPSARSRRRRPASPTTPSHSARPTPRAMLSARSRTSRPVSPSSPKPKPGLQRRLSLAQPSRRAAEILEVHPSPASKGGGTRPANGSSPDALSPSRSAPIVMPLRLGALLRHDSEGAAARQEQDLLRFRLPSPYQQAAEARPSMCPASPDADLLSTARSQETQGSCSARSTVQYTPRQPGSAPVTPQYRDATAARGRVGFQVASEVNKMLADADWDDTPAYPAVPQLSQIAEASWEGSRTPLQQQYSSQTATHDRVSNPPLSRQGDGHRQSFSKKSSSPRPSIQALGDDAGTGYSGTYTMKAMRGSSSTRPTSSGGLGSRGSPRRHRAPFAG